MGRIDLEMERMNYAFSLLHTDQPMDEVYSKMKEFRDRQSDRIGTGSELRAVHFLFDAVYFIEEVRLASLVDDQYGIDIWAKLDQMRSINHGLPEYLPVQIVSSDKGVEYFRNSRKYRELGKKVLVLNAGYGMSKTRFKRQARKEILRIRKIYELY